MTEQQETIIFELLTAAGTAKSCYIEALQAAKEGNYAEADRLIQAGDDATLEGHRGHGVLAETPDMTVNLILAHVEDQMMSAETIKLMVAELIELYRKLDK